MQMKPAPLILTLMFAVAPMALRAEPAGHCPASIAGLATFNDRAGSLARFEQLPSACLETLFLRCSREAGERMLDLGDAAICSYGYEALLKRRFGGDFNAMLAWWRAHREDPIAGQPPSVKTGPQR